jgi:hypothetical protein
MEIELFKILLDHIESSPLLAVLVFYIFIKDFSGWRRYRNGNGPNATLDKILKTIEKVSYEVRLLSQQQNSAHQKQEQNLNKINRQLEERKG